MIELPEDTKQRARALFGPPPSGEIVEFIDVAPRPIDVKIPLVDWFEHVKRHKADRWQRDFCQRLQDAAVNRMYEAAWHIVHAEAQLGKTSILSQAYPAWILGHDPLFRLALAMYNQTRAQAIAKVVIQIMQSRVYKDVFPDAGAQLVGKRPSAEGFVTQARADMADSQLSFNPVGLQSGLTGSGADLLLIDDPYANQQDAFSTAINESMRNFWEFTVKPRLGEFSNVIGMFHRYAPEDLAGYLLDNEPKFDYLRYASIFDGDYVHESTGRVYPDPIGREVGELISPERRGFAYYEDKKRNNRVWLAMFQGKPSSEEGTLFNVGRIKTISAEDAVRAREECILAVRSYDNAATEEAGAYSVGAKMAIRPDNRIVVFDVWRRRVDTAGRLEAMRRNAERDGAETAITIPIDPGSAGKDVVFFTRQSLGEYVVTGRPTTTNKETRAQNFSVAVNAGEVEFVDDSGLEPDDQWIRTAKKELRDFPLSEYKDIVDAMSDGYNHLFENARRGLVVANYRPQRNVVTRESFMRSFPLLRFDPNARELANTFRIPEHWTVYCGLKLSLDASRPTSAVLVARAAVNSNLPETLFVFGEYKAYDNDFYKLFSWMDRTLSTRYGGRDVAIWATPDSEAALTTINVKLPWSVALFKGDAFKGLTELNWYLKPRPIAHPFNQGEESAGIFLLVDADQFSVAAVPRGNDDGAYHARQELATWGYDDKGKPTAIGQVVDCLRLVTAQFRTDSTPRTAHEEFREMVADVLPVKNDDGTYSLSFEEQQNLQFRTALALDTLAQRHGEEILETPLPKNIDWEGECEICSRPFVGGESVMYHDEFGQCHSLCASEREQFQNFTGNNGGKEWWK